MRVIFILLVSAGFISDNIYIHIAALLFAAVYAVVLAPGAFGGGSELDKNKMENVLSETWTNSDQICAFIVKYWYSMKYIFSAQARGANCSTISLISFALAGWYFYTDAQVWLGACSIANGILLLLIGNRVNKALFILRHEQNTPQWNLACASFIALSETSSDDLYKEFVKSLFDIEQIATVKAMYGK